MDWAKGFVASRGHGMRIKGSETEGCQELRLQVRPRLAASHRALFSTVLVRDKRLYDCVFRRQMSYLWTGFETGPDRCHWGKRNGFGMSAR